MLKSLDSSTGGDGPVIERGEFVKIESLLHMGENSIVTTINMFKSLVQDVQAEIKVKAKIIEFAATECSSFLEFRSSGLLS